ncbi:hypothetical protein M422DRAFT_240479 [Sphaerobolus stellatus SS14]|nr:hypothetical protein M422DRAFT_240479 [Sphaerobolus stellatus SS14]
MDVDADTSEGESLYAHPMRRFARHLFAGAVNFEVDDKAYHRKALASRLARFATARPRHGDASARTFRPVLDSRRDGLANVTPSLKAAQLAKSAHHPITQPESDPAYTRQRTKVRMPCGPPPKSLAGTSTDSCASLGVLSGFRYHITTYPNESDGMVIASISITNATSSQ